HIDVTEWATARAELHANAVELEAARAESTAIVESISDAFYAVDAEFRFTFLNRRAEDLWGLRREELLGRHYWTVFAAAVGSELYHMHQMVMSERRPVRYETLSPILHRWIEVSLHPA